MSPHALLYTQQPRLRRPSMSRQVPLPEPPMENEPPPVEDEPPPVEDEPPPVEAPQLPEDSAPEEEPGGEDTPRSTLSGAVPPVVPHGEQPVVHSPLPSPSPSPLSSRRHSELRLDSIPPAVAEARARSMSAPMSPGGGKHVSRACTRARARACAS